MLAGGGGLPALLRLLDEGLPRLVGGGAAGAGCTPYAGCPPCVPFAPQWLGVRLCGWWKGGITGCLASNCMWYCCTDATHLYSLTTITYDITR